MSDYEIVPMQEVYSYSMSDTVGTFRVHVCTKCGMPVAKSYTETHDAWHEEMDKGKIW